MITIISLFLLDFDDIASRLVPNAISLLLGKHSRSVSQRAYTHISHSDIADGCKGEQMGGDEFLQMYTDSILRFPRHEY